MGGVCDEVRRSGVCGVSSHVLLLPESRDFFHLRQPERFRSSIRPNVSREGEPAQHRHQWTAWTGLPKREVWGERIRNGGGLGWRHRPSELGSATSPRSNKAAPALGELGMELGGESRSADCSGDCSSDERGGARGGPSGGGRRANAAATCLPREANARLVAEEAAPVTALAVGGEAVAGEGALPKMALSAESSKADALDLRTLP